MLCEALLPKQKENYTHMTVFLAFDTALVSGVRQGGGWVWEHV